jgi:hypothetical protein
VRNMIVLLGYFVLSAVLFFGGLGVILYFQSRSDNGYGYLAARVESTPDGSLIAQEASAAPVPEETPSPSLYRTYRGRIDDLPEVARDVLQFVPARSEEQTQGESYMESVEELCGFRDLLGSGEFPGTVKVDPPIAHGWTVVTWNLGKCDGVGSSFAGPSASLAFQISADHQYVKTTNTAAFNLTH